jgi:uncharacterized coiled-coil protein SlyX
MDNISEAILTLERVTFRYNEEIDPDGFPQFRLVAEDVKKVDRDLVVRDEDGKVTTARYEAVNMMLLNEFLEEHWTVTKQQTSVAEQECAIAALKTTVAQQQKQIEALAGKLQKVSVTVQLKKASPTRVVATR